MRAFATKSPPLQRVTIILIVLSGLILALFAWFPAETLLDAARALDRTPPEPATPDDVTRRTTESGDVVGFIGNHGARTWREPARYGTDHAGTPGPISGHAA